eukprot:TRINITY_DN970_c0_g1_i2.p1 TRINITY_DN970_c0_g1~~TRINITY_DN970_c0_g1_i2.p1  ORF type:complete len:205 (-),score=12.50 TRINITY_DN970_c0_g1_i2:53-667(-)
MIRFLFISILLFIFYSSIQADYRFYSLTTYSGDNCTGNITSFTVRPLGCIQGDYFWEKWVCERNAVVTYECDANCSRCDLRPYQTHRTDQCLYGNRWGCHEEAPPTFAPTQAPTQAPVPITPTQAPTQAPVLITPPPNPIIPSPDPIIPSPDPITPSRGPLTLPPNTITSPPAPLVDASDTDVLTPTTKSVRRNKKYRTKKIVS